MTIRLGENRGSYYAGSTRVAMSTETNPFTLNFLLGDHLGSTSITTDSYGNFGLRFYITHGVVGAGRVEAYRQITNSPIKG